MLEQLIRIVTEANTLAGGLAALAATVRELRAQGHDLPPAPALDALLAAFEAERAGQAAAIDQWMRDRGRDPRTGQKIQA